MSNVQPLCAVLTKYPWNQQYPLGSIGTKAQVLIVAGGGSDVSVYRLNWRCNFVMRVFAKHSSEVSVAFMVDNVTTAWQSAVVAVERFESAWAWVCSV